MQISNLLPSSSQTLEATSTYSCGGTVAIIACAVFAAIIVSSALVLANVIALSIPTALLIVAISISTVGLMRLIGYVNKLAKKQPHLSLALSSPEVPSAVSNPSLKVSPVLEPIIQTIPSMPIVTVQSTVSSTNIDNMSIEKLTAEERALAFKFSCKEPACLFHPNDPLSADEQLVLNAWSELLYTDMNACMIGEKIDPQIQHINEVAIEALAKLPVTPNQAALLRGATFTSEQLTTLYQVDKIYVLDRFMSTAKSDEIPVV